jgi:hypothetical protein
MIPLGDIIYDIKYSNEEHLLLLFMGRTLAEIQQFEGMLCFMLTAIIEKQSGEADFDKIMEQHQDKTLGQVANIMKSHFHDKELSEELMRIKDQRNYFIHGFLRKYGWPFMGEKEYLKALDEMELFQKYLKSVHMRIGKHIADSNIAEIGVGCIDKVGNVEIIADNVDRQKKK